MLIPSRAHSALLTRRGIMARLSNLISPKPMQIFLVSNISQHTRSSLFCSPDLTRDDNLRFSSQTSLLRLFAGLRGTAGVLYASPHATGECNSGGNGTESKHYHADMIFLRWCKLFCFPQRGRAWGVYGGGE